MANAGAVRAGSAFIEIFANDSKFQQGLKKIESKLKATAKNLQTIGKGFMGVGAAIGAPILAAAKSFADFGSEIFDMSQRTGIAAESLSILRYAAEQSGSDIASLETAVKKMQKTIDSARTGSKSAAEALGRIGLTAEQLAGMKPEDQLSAIADGLLGIQDPGERAAIALEIFGRAGTGILPMLSGGSAGLNAFAAQARKLGLVMDAETAAKADALGDALNDLKRAMFSAFIEIGSAVAPALTKIAKVLSETAAAVGRFIREHRKLIQVALVAAAVLFGVGAAFYFVGGAVRFLAAGFGILRAAMALIPMLANPVALAIVAIIAVVAGLIVAARQLSPAFRKEFDAIVTGIGKLDFSTAWEIFNLNVAIALAIAARDISWFLGWTKQLFVSAGRYMGDKLIEGLDRFMEVFGLDILMIEEHLAKMAAYTMAAFDWNFWADGLDDMLQAIEEKFARLRKEAPTADARAKERDAKRKETNEEELRQGVNEWNAVVDDLRQQLDRAHKKLDDKGNPDAKQFDPVVQPDLSGLEDLLGKTAGVGGTLGSFSGDAATMLGIGPELADPAKETAENTKKTVQILGDMQARAQAQELAMNQAAERGRSGVAAAAVAMPAIFQSPEIMDALAGVQASIAQNAVEVLAAPAAPEAPAAPAVPPMPTIPDLGPGAAAAAAAAASIPSRAAAARAGAEAASESVAMRDTMVKGFKDVVAAISEHVKISQQHTSILGQIATNTSRTPAFA